MTRQEWVRAFQQVPPGQLRKALYTKYINSASWNQSTQRLACIERARGRCELCGRKGKQVHHKTYYRIGNELPEDLLYLCLDCHEYQHVKWNKPK